MKAAIRHLIRNRRRSLLTLLAVLCPVYILVIMFGFASATMNDMFDTVTRVDTGHLQIRHVETRASGSATPLIQDPAPILAALAGTEGIEWSTVRLDLPALASAGDRSRTVLIQGVVPEEIDPISSMRSRIVEGAYITSDSPGVIVGKEFAALLQLEVGDEFVLLGAHPEIGVVALRVPVVGIVDVPIAELGRSVVQAPLALVRELARSPSAATSVVVRVAGVTGTWDTDTIDAVAQNLRAALPSDYEVLDWRDLVPQVEVYMRLLNPAIAIVAAVFFALGALVVLNTVYLSVMERTKELGLILSLGASRGHVVRMILTEAALLAAVGAAGGAVAGVALILLVEALGGIPLSGDFQLFAKAMGMSPALHLRVAALQTLLAASAMAAVALLAAWYPARRASHLEPVEAMRYVE
ncbi:MAG: FtsX-like permease family protein [Candidatus Bipolaricaulota bacterium]|nr:FtsX-like permease family protein [Candidatus Bipolaricaulota bacterium]